MSLFGRIRKLGRLDKEIDEELRFHLEEKERRLIAEGLSPAEARREARKSFGSPAAVREYTRDAWIFRWADDLWRDLRFAARGLRRSPGFTAVAVLTLALGIGACTTIFTLVNALLLRNLPVQNPEELVWFGVDDPDHWSQDFSFRLYELLRDGDGPFDGFAGVARDFSGLTIDGVTNGVANVHLVTGEYFQLLGASPAIGRLLNEEDMENGAVCVLSNSLWRERFGADPAIVGQTIVLRGEPYTVVGVAQPGFVGTDASYAPQVWLTIGQGQRPGWPDWRSINARFAHIFGRRRAGASFEEAQAYAETIYDRFEKSHLAEVGAERREQFKQRYASEVVRLEPVSASSPAARREHVERFLPLAAAVGLVLLLCCANVANLLLGRGVRRRRELGVRLATGASRSRVIRQLLAEGALLSFAGCAFGIGLSVALSRYLHREAGLIYTPSLETGLDVRVTAFAVGISTLCVVLAVLFPALDASRIPLAEAMRGSRGDQRRTLGSRGLLTAAQFALCLPLLVSAALLIQTVSNLLSQDVGFERSQRLHATVALHATGVSGERGMVLLNQLLGNLQAQQGFSQVGYSAYGTLGFSYSTRSVQIATPEGGERQAAVASSDLSEGYFETMGIPLLAGRDFRPSDDAVSAKVAIVNQAFAREVEVSNPVGLIVGGREIVGLVGDAKYYELREPAEPQIFYPYRQSSRADVMQVYVATDMGLEPFKHILQEQVRRLDRSALVDGFGTMDMVIEARTQEERAVSTLLSGFGLLALFITAIGLYSVIAFDVSRRTREVGVRVALGARKGDIHRMVFRRGAPWVFGGCAVGLAATAAMTRLLEAKLFGVSALDSATVATAAALLLACAALANYLPARRAASVEPMTALRHD